MISVQAIACTENKGLPYTFKWAPLATGIARRLGQNPDPLVITDGLHLAPGPPGQRADAEIGRVRSCHDLSLLKVRKKQGLNL